MKQLNLLLLALLFSYTSFAVIGPITGISSTCQGSTTTLSDTTTGGTWSSSNPAIVTIGSTSGVANGVAAGSATITYTKGSSYVTTSFYVNALPSVYTLYVVGSGGICTGGPGEHIYLSGSQPGVSYQLYNGTTPVGSPMSGSGGVLDFGSFTTPGSYTCVAINSTTGCTSNMSGPATITALATPGPIAGPSAVCLGATIALTDTASGGTWSSTNPAVATVGSTGVVNGITSGSTTISYTLTSGCTATTTINAVNTISSITGSTIGCIGQTTALADASPGGSWTSSNTAVATVGSSTGIVTGVTAGTVTISYTVGGSCGAAAHVMTVNATPSPITGITSICQGAVSTLHDVSTGGTWSSNDTTIASIGSTSGIALGVAAGTVAISYTVNGCSSGTSFTVDARPVITGPTNVCATSFITLHTSINGSWTSSNPGVASVTTGYMVGIVNGVYPGTAVMTCNSYTTGCVSTYTVTVTSTCTGTPVAGTANSSSSLLCSGSIDTLYLTGATTSCGISYQWQSSTDSLAWIDVPGATSDTTVINPEANLYYRCKLTCFTTGGYAYSAGVHVGIYNHITAHNVINSPSYLCIGPDFQVSTCGVAPATNILTYYGDGTSDSTHVSGGTGPTTSNIYHAYNLPGVYSVKQVLRNGITRQDSVTFTTSYNYCHTLLVTFYFDANSNCAFDGGDGLMYRPVTTEVDSNGIAIDTITAINGFYYKALGDSGTVYEFKVLSYDTGLHISCPSTGILFDTIGAYTNTYTTKFFGFNCNTSTDFDLSLSATMSCSRHTADGFIYVHNTHCDTVSPVVTMKFSPKYAFSWSSPAPYSVSGTTVTWHLSPLSVYSGSAWPTISYQLSVPGALLTTGDTVNANFKVTPYSGDVDTTNNYITRVDTIVASYDPNRIAVAPSGYIIPCTPLLYTVSFDNCGNDTAHNVSVIDTLPDNADPSTISLVAASTSVNLFIATAGTHTLVKFDFPGINLPDSTHHGLSTGMVAFSVKAKQSLADGSTLFNHASIYFDDNLPVMTNTVEGIIGISPITGSSSLCNTTQMQLNDQSANGIWSSSNTNATVSAGLVTAAHAGTDTIKYTLSNSCATKIATKVVTINPVVVPSVAIVSGTGLGDSVCDGVIPTFSVTPTNGGTAPTFTWTVNGSSSDTGTTFSDLHDANGDVITVNMKSNANCAIPDTAVKSIVLTVLTPYVAPVTLTAYPGQFIGAGMPDTFVATIPFGSPVPTYQWLRNGVPISGATSDTFITNTLINNDSITVVATGTDVCHLSTFNSLIVTVGNVGVKNITSNAAMVIFPNPNKGTFTLKGKTGSTTDQPLNLEIINMLGQAVYKTSTLPQNGLINIQIQPDIPLAKGMYLLNVHTGTDDIVFRFVVE